ncbi:Nif3-like dinuclear metal center hexameric protein [Desulfogranum mediterraneum]|uniref:Nif3-like dinuclear metal center hexameric protein n=1 Tax=Desulfogranum mediterraneum TaxID=160661 RepID=UPI0003F7984E|nr:Nif3-like dinuclear metal center hexameric protein [Desulfogranum mediterraneum]
MAPTVQELISLLQDIAPEPLAEPWDNVGLLIGNPSQEIGSILLALDPSPTLINDAVARGCDLIITHHPAIFHPLKAIRTDQPIGRLIALALQHNIAVIGCHTNLDATPGGVSDVLAAGLGLTVSGALVNADHPCNEERACGLGRIGSYAAPLSPLEFIARLRSSCKPPWLLEAGPRPQQVRTVAVCGGSCGDYAQLAMDLGAEVFVTAEIKHATARWAEDAGFWIIDGGHFATENPAMVILKQRLEQQLSRAGWTVKVTTAALQPPLRLIEKTTTPPEPTDASAVT